ncbi:MAG: hypothetical protein RLZ12_554 [Bacillota bacterium]|jgi:hypothetical protein
MYYYPLYTNSFNEIPYASSLESDVAPTNENLVGFQIGAFQGTAFPSSSVPEPLPPAESTAVPYFNLPEVPFIESLETDGVLPYEPLHPNIISDEDVVPPTPFILPEHIPSFSSEFSTEFNAPPVAPTAEQGFEAVGPQGTIVPVIVPPPAAPTREQVSDVPQGTLGTGTVPALVPQMGTVPATYDELERIDAEVRRSQERRLWELQNAVPRVQQPPAVSMPAFRPSVQDYQVGIPVPPPQIGQPIVRKHPGSLTKFIGSKRERNDEFINPEEAAAKRFEPVYSVMPLNTEDVRSEMVINPAYLSMEITPAAATNWPSYYQGVRRTDLYQAELQKARALSDDLLQAAITDAKEYIKDATNLQNLLAPVPYFLALKDATDSRALNASLQRTATGLQRNLTIKLNQLSRV